MADEKKKEEAPKAGATAPAGDKGDAKAPVVGGKPAAGGKAGAPAAAPAAAPAPGAPAAAPPAEKKVKPSARHAGSAKAARRKLRKKKSQIQARRKKEFTYRGYSMEELLKMPMAEIIELLPARARRTYIRGLNTEQEAFVKRLRRAEGRPVKTHRREIPIIPEFVGKTVH